MKTLLTLAFMSLALNASAARIEAPQYYQPEFQIDSVKPICPTPKPGQVTCMAFGYKVTISTTLGCLDKMVFHDVKTVPTKNGIELHSVAVALLNPVSLKAMCLVANTVTKTITIPSIEGGEPVLINSIIEN